MSNSIKKSLLMLLTIFLLFTLVGCSGSNNIEIEEAPETETVEEHKEEIVVEEAKEDPNYPNVEGYPIEKSDVKLCKLYFDGYECFCDGYTKDENPDVVYMIALEAIYDATHSENGFVSGRDNDVSFCACINGKLVLNKLGENILNIDGEIYEDMAPEMRVVFEDYNDYCCTTLFLEKTLGAKVTLSQDRSAAYIETTEKVDENESRVYDLDIIGEGKLIAKNKNTGEKKTIIYNEKGMTISAGSTNNGNSSNNHGPEKQICTACGGSGQVMGSTNVLNPMTGTYTMQPAMVRCTVCGGSGYR